ncbi:MAG: DUF3553 domain-containing protein [Pelagibacteraceae bacterium TMED259]|nr:MAG: DUF3553 domain-containing protein [Pelagibacteraceae bacterium TMED259]
MEKNFIFSEFTPGTLVKCPSQPSWGIGQIQSCIANKATINFENSGKKVIDLEVVNLEVVHSVS